MEETIAVSGELTNINNYRVVLEEILKMKGNLQRRDIPLNTNLLSPAEQVSVRGGSRKKVFGGPGPSSFGRQQWLSGITIEIIILSALP